MKRARWIGILLLAGCVPLTAKGVGREIELTIYPKIAPKTQAILNPNTLSSIATLDIIPYVFDSGEYKPISSVTGNPTIPGAVDLLKLTQASPTIDPNRPFVIRHLKPNKDYRVRAQAYNQSNALISENSTSYVDVSVGNNDTPPMANLPVNLINTTFAANTSVLIDTDGRYEFLKATLYLVAGGAPVAIAQTHHLYPTFSYSNLQGATDYRLLIEAYKLNTMMASTSLTFNPGNETSPATQSVSLTIPYVVTTLAGSGSAAFADGTGTSAAFNRPHGIAFDGQSALYVGDLSNHRIRKVDINTGAVTTLAGNGVATFADGVGTSASFNTPHGVTCDRQGNLFVADIWNHRIRKIALSTGAVTTFAGNGTASTIDATTTAASFNLPRNVDIDSFGNIYVAETNGCRIRKITSAGVVSTIAGNGGTAVSDGIGTNAGINKPEGLGVDNQGNLYIADTKGRYIRHMNLSTGMVTTIAGNGVSAIADGTGTSAQIGDPVCVLFDGKGNLFVSEFTFNRIRKINLATKVVTTIVGSGEGAYLDGTGTSAKLSNPEAIAIDNNGILYLAEYGSNRIRKIE